MVTFMLRPHSPLVLNFIEIRGILLETKQTSGDPLSFIMGLFHVLYSNSSKNLYPERVTIKYSEAFLSNILISFDCDSAIRVYTCSSQQEKIQIGGTFQL